MVGKVMEECDRIMPLIDSILEIAKADTGMLVLHEEEFDLAAEVRTAHALFSGIAEDRKINFSCTVPDEPMPMTGDRSRMQRVVANLLDNALKFTPEGGRVSVLLKREGNNAILEGADNGPGIPAEETNRVFERFYRLDQSRNSTGHGLGLSLVKAFAKAFGGTVKIVSSMGSGCTVTVAIPLAGSPAT
jgi:signal transduction histidine kinase